MLKNMKNVNTAISCLTFAKGNNLYIELKRVSID
jgi:hypothetical protein